MVRESGLFKMLEFDLWMFFFAIFQLILTNVIIFKLNFKYMDPDLIVFSTIMLSRRILCKANHYYQVNIYRVNLIMFTILRSIPLSIFCILIWFLTKIAIFNSLVNLICVLIPSIMYCVIFGIPRGVFTISSSSFMVHPIFNPEQSKDSGKSSDTAKKENTNGSTTSNNSSGRANS